MPTAAELALILKFRDQATVAAKAAFQSVAQAGQQAANLPRRAFEAFEGTVNRINSVIRLFRRFLFEVTLAMSPLIGALAIAAQNNTVVAEQFQRIQRTIRDVATQIGIRLLPVLEAFADWVQSNFPRILAWIDEMPTRLARALFGMGQTLAELAQEVSGNPLFGPEASAALVAMARGFQHAGRTARDFGRTVQAAAADANTATSQMGAGIRVVFQDAYDRLSNFGNLAKELATTGINGLQTSMETMFTSLITRSQSAKEAFRNFALGVLQMVGQMIAKLIAAVILMSLLRMIPGVGPAIAAAQSIGSVIKVGMPQQVKHAGGMIQSFQHGGEVPILAEAGEFVVNRTATSRNRGLLERLNRGEGGGGGQPQIVNIWNISATDAQSFRAQMQQNSDLVESMFQRAIRRNSGPMRESVRLA